MLVTASFFVILELSFKRIHYLMGKRKLKTCFVCYKTTVTGLERFMKMIFLVFLYKVDFFVACTLETKYCRS